MSGLRPPAERRAALALLRLATLRLTPLLLTPLLLAPLLVALLLLPAAPAAAVSPPSPVPMTSSASHPAAAAAVLEVLRLRVPAEHREAWLAAERATWEPWLARQEGFLGRELFWDPQRQEGHLLIRWETRAQWKAIPAEAVNGVQERFETLARELTGSADPHPFPLVFEGELLPV